LEVFKHLRKILFLFFKSAHHLTSLGSVLLLPVSKATRVEIIFITDDAAGYFFH